MLAAFNPHMCIRCIQSCLHSIPSLLTPHGLVHYSGARHTDEQLAVFPVALNVANLQHIYR